MNILYQGMEQVFVKNTWGFTPESILGVFIAILAIVCIVVFVIAIIEKEAIAILCFIGFLWFAFFHVIVFIKNQFIKML